MSDRSSVENLPVVEGVLVADGNEPSNDVSNGEGDFELPRIEDRDGPAALVSTTVEAHTVVSALVLACAVGCDALSAKDLPIDAVDCPSSLRVSSLVLTAMVGSPKIKGIHLVDQRVLLGSLLLALAFSGLHQGTEEMRTADCVFSTLVLLMTIQIYKSGGIETEDVRPDSVQDTPHRRQTVSGLCAALFVYCGARGIRDAFVYGSTAADYKVGYQTANTEITAYGYAHATVYASAPLGFGYGIILCLGILIGLHDETHLTGSSAIAFEAGASGVAACVAAVWALIGQAKSIESLLILYGPGSCSGGHDVCYEAARSRRLAMINGSTGPLWVAGLAAMVFSFAVEKRFLNSNPTNAESVWKQQGMGIALALFGAAAVAVLTNTQLDGAQWHTEICTVAALFGAFLSSVSDTLLGTTIYAIAMTYEQAMLLQNYGVKQVFVHLTHCTLFVSLALMWAHVALMALKDVLIGRSFDVNSDSIINRGLGIVATLGTSLTFGLYLASAVLLAASNGQIPQEEGDMFRGGSPTRSMIAFALDHFMPLFVWIPLYACRCEVNLVTAWTRAIAWLVAVPLQAFFYIVLLAILGRAAPTVSIIQFSGASVVGFGCAIAWTVSAFV
jgi:hypothetical protein